MLTKQDLSQIKNLLQPVNNRLDKIDQKLFEHDKKFDNIDTQFKVVNKKLNKLQIDLATTIEYFDVDVIHNKKRLNRIETHLGLSALSFT